MLNVSPVNLFCTILNLLILLFLMKKFLYKPVLSVIAKRKELIESRFEEAKQSKEEAYRLKEQYENCLLEVKEEKAAILKEAKMQAMSDCGKIMDETHIKARQIILDAKAAGKREKEKIIKEAETEIVDLAMAAASKLLDEKDDGKTDSSMYEELQKEAGE